MSHFYGKLYGTRRNPATSCGSKGTGITAHAASFAGAIEVSLTYDPTDDCDRYTVRQIPWQGVGHSGILCGGVVGQPPKPSTDELRHFLVTCHVGGEKKAIRITCESFATAVERVCALQGISEKDVESVESVEPIFE